MASRRTGRATSLLRLEGRRWHRRRMAHYVYVLRSADDSLYVGETSNLAARERCHNEGRGGNYSAQRRPVRIVYAEEHCSKRDALKRERQIKRWSQQKKELLARGESPALSGNSSRTSIRAGFTWADWLVQQRRGRSYQGPAHSAACARTARTPPPFGGTAQSLDVRPQARAVRGDPFNCSRRMSRLRATTPFTEPPREPNQ